MLRDTHRSPPKVEEVACIQPPVAPTHVKQLISETEKQSLYIPLHSTFQEHEFLDAQTNGFHRPTSALCWGCVALHCPQQVEKIVLDYDEKSVITIFNQTSRTKTVYEGAEVRQ